MITFRITFEASYPEEAWKKGDVEDLIKEEVSGQLRHYLDDAELETIKIERV